MDDPHNTDPPHADRAVPTSEGNRLLERYGDHLDGQDLSAAQKGEFLLALWQIMTAFVDLGFSVKPGDKFTATAQIGMDDVLKSLLSEDPAPATEAPKNNNKETPT